MGCKLTKLVASELHHDAIINRPPPPHDPRSPLTTKQQYCMQASWKGVSRQIEKTGIMLFIKLFEGNEDLIQYFRNFAELMHNGQLASSEELAEHATKVMATLDGGIKNLGDIDAFFVYVKHVGATHHQVPGFKAENFWKIEEPFLQAAKTTLGERYTPNVENLYKITIKFILENLVQGFEEEPQKIDAPQT